MKKIFSFFKKNQLKKIFKLTLQRFPVPILLSILLTGISIYLIGIHNYTESVFIQFLEKSAFTFSILFFLSVGISLFMESLGKNDTKSYILSQIPVVIFGLLFYLGLNNGIENFNFIIYILLTLTGIISFIFFAPFTQNIWTKKNIDQIYFHYFYKVSVVFFITSIVAFSLSLLGNGAIMAVENLFDIQFSNSGDIYGYWTTISLVFLAPLFFLSELPKKEDFFDETKIINVFLHFLLKYILIPFIYIYFIILYAYSIKVLINFSDWPKGEISWLVIMFSIFGYISYIFSSLFVESKETNFIILLFRKYFPFVVIPQLAMLFYAIGLRIGQYDLTMNRYFVVVFGLWLLGISTYLIVSKTKSLLSIPASLTLITVLISLGPWGVYSLPLERQTARLEKNLKTANILNNGVITPLENYTDIDENLSKQIYDGIEYVCNYNDCKNLENIFPQIIQEIEDQDFQDYQNNEGNYSYYSDEYNKDETIGKPEYSGLNSWDLINKISTRIRVQSFSIPYESDELSFVSINGDISYPIAITGYDEIVEISDFNNSYNKSEYIIDSKKETFTIKSEDAAGEVIDISELFEKLRAKKEISSEDFFTLSSTEHDFKFLISNAYIPTVKATIGDDESNGYHGYISGYILIKNK